jgi:hypothetical protein
MFQQVNPNEMPGVGGSVLNINRAIWLGRAGVQYLPGGARIDGANARDPSNTGAQWETSGAVLPPFGVTTPNGSTITYASTLQAGLLMGVIGALNAGQTTTGVSSASVKMFGASIFGLVGGDNLAANATSIKVPAAVGAEISRRVGTTGNIKIIGPPTAGGTMATQTVTLSNIVATTSVYTTLTLSNSAQLLYAVVAGSLICPADGSDAISTFIDELDGIRVTDIYLGNLMVQFPRVPIAGGIVNTANLINYTSGAGITGTAAATITVDTSVRKWIKAQLNSAGTAAITAVGPSGAFRFSDDFGG